MSERQRKLDEENSALIGQVLTQLKDGIEEVMVIGSANKRWEDATIEGIYTATDGVVYYGQLSNTGAGDFIASFRFLKPAQKVWLGTTYNLVLTRARVGLADADAGDYLDRFLLFGVVDYDTKSTLIDDHTNYTAAQEVVYDFADQTIGGSYISVLSTLSIVATDIWDYDSLYLQFEYYYASS